MSSVRAGDRCRVVSHTTTVATTAEFDDQTGALADRRWRRMVGALAALALAVALDDPEPIGLILPLWAPSTVTLVIHGFLVRVPCGPGNRNPPVLPDVPAGRRRPTA